MTVSRMRAPRPMPLLIALGLVACDPKKEETAPPPLCNSAVPKECFDRGMSLRHSHPAKAEQALDMACRAALPEACNNLGLLYLDPPKGLAGDVERASLLFALACEHRVAQSCHALAGMHVRGQHVEQNPKKALELYEKACDMGHHAGCDQAGTMLANGRGRKANHNDAMVLWDKACTEGGVPHACAAVGINLALGIQGVTKDAERGAKLLTAACQADYAAACKDLGGLHLAKVIPDADVEQGIVLLKNACNLSYGEGCNELGVVHAQGIGVDRSPQQAVKLFERACELQSMSGCGNLGVALEHGDGIAADVERAKTLYGKACKGGHEASCKRLESREGGAKEKAQ